VKQGYGWLPLAAGLSFWLLGFVMDLHVAEIISSLSSADTPPKIAALNIQWVKKTYWLAPYLLSIGGALVVVGGALATIGLIFARQSADSEKDK